MKKAVSIVLILFTILICSSCNNGLNNFEEYKLTEAGVLSWNKIKEAKYYYVTCGSEDTWTEKTKINISSYFKEKEENYVKINAFTSKSLLGALEVDELSVHIIKLNDKFFETEALPKYKVNYSYVIDGELSTQLTSKSIEGYKATVSPSITEETSSYYTITEGCFYNKECTQPVSTDNGIFYPTADITLYRKATSKYASIQIYLVYGKETILDYTYVFKCGTKIYENDIRIPAIDGYTYSGIYYFAEWSGKVSFPYVVTRDNSLYIKYKTNS